MTLELAAIGIRTGHVISTDYGHPHTLEVAYVLRDTFTGPEGVRLPRVRFSGWDETGMWREAWMGVRDTDRVRVLDDLRDEGVTFGALARVRAPAVSAECRASRCGNCWDDTCACPWCDHPTALL